VQLKVNRKNTMRFDRTYNDLTLRFVIERETRIRSEMYFAYLNGIGLHHIL